MLSCVTFQLISQQNHLSKDLAIDHFKIKYKKTFLIQQFHSEYVIYKDIMNHCFFVLSLQHSLPNCSLLEVIFVVFLPTLVAFMTWALDVIALAAPVNFISWVN